MGWAIKKDKTSFRAVNGSSFCQPDEDYSEDQPVIESVIPSIENMRLGAYADPIYGSDRYLSEAASLIAAGADPQSPDVKALQTQAVTVKNSIKEMFPYPAQE